MHFSISEATMGLLLSNINVRVDGWDANLLSVIQEDWSINMPLNCLSQTGHLYLEKHGPATQPKGHTQQISYCEKVRLLGTCWIPKENKSLGGDRLGTRDRDET